MDLPLPLVEVEGTPGECGVAYGTVARELIVANTANYLDRFATVAGLDRPAVRRAGTLFRNASRHHVPRVADLLDGVAEGSGVPVEEIYAINARTELLYGQGVTECTAIGVLDTRSASGHTVLAQNWDWHPAQRPFTVLLATRDEYGSTVVTLTEAGMAAKVGLNDAGLGVGVNLLGCDRDGGPGGVPYHVLLRAVMEQRVLGSALKVACATPRSASINLLIGQAFPDGVPGEIIDLEVAPGTVGWLHPVDGIITHANHFESSLPLHDMLRDLGGSSLFRSARARRLLGTGHISGPISDKDLHTVLADHGGYPQSICRHDEGAVNEEDRTESLYAVVLDLDERCMSIAAGPSCQAPAYSEVRLGRLFA